MLNLINDQWIPIKRRDGQQQLIRPAQITSEQDNPIIAIDSPRADFNGAIIQFLIGLIQTVAAPKTLNTWRLSLNNPPTTEELQAKFAKVAKAFNLAGDGPRFMQDLNLDTELKTEAAKLGEKEAKKKLADRYTPIDNLLIDSVAGYFNKPGTINRLCPACAAMALLTLQTNAPSGGRGHRTSLRGGGPLTTLVLGRSLWQTIWLNVLLEDEFLNLYNSKDDLEDKFTEKDIFPWLAATRTSEANQTAVPDNTHHAQMFWGMPRRIQLDFTHLESGNCDIDQTFSDQLISRYTTKSYGINYGDGWQHTLTPHYQDKAGPPMPVHGQPGGLSYRHWLGLVQSAKDDDGKGGRQRAKVVDSFMMRQSLYPNWNEVFAHNTPQLWVFGYDMDNMKPRAWVESTMPIISLANPAEQLQYESIIKQLIDTAKVVADNTRKCVKQGLFKPAREVRGDLSFIDAEFWQKTEIAFYQTLHSLREDLNQALTLKDQWLTILQEASLHLFDQLVQMGDLQSGDPKRIVLARRSLQFFNSRKSKNIAQALNVPKESKK